MKEASVENFMKRRMYTALIIFTICMICLTCRITAFHPSQANYGNSSAHSTVNASSAESFTISHGMLAKGGAGSSPLCIFGAGEGGTVTIGSQMDVREVFARVSIGSMDISDTPVNIRYAFDATRLVPDPEENLPPDLASDPKNNLATGSARVHSNVDMDTFSGTDPTINGHFQDRQEQRVSGQFSLSTTFEYTT